MGNKTRKDGAFKGEGTSLRGEERKEGGKKRRIREGVGEPHLAIPFVSVLPFPRAVETRYYDDQRCVYIDINAIYSGEVSSFELSPITDE